MMLLKVFILTKLFLCILVNFCKYVALMQLMIHWNRSRRIVLSIDNEGFPPIKLNLLAERDECYQCLEMTLNIKLFFFYYMASMFQGLFLQNSSIIIWQTMSRLVNTVCHLSLHCCYLNLFYIIIYYYEYQVLDNT